MKTLSFVLLIFVLLLTNAAFAAQANVFIYHRFDDSHYPSTNISRQDFRAHLDFLSQQKISVLKLSQVVEILQRGLNLPQHCAVITVDDAYRSFLTGGWPLLKEYGYPVTLFVSTDMVGGGGYLSWQEIKVLQDEGVEIGNHSASHAYLLDWLASESEVDWRTRVSEDIIRSQQAFEIHLGSSPRLFAYPYGEFAPELADFLKTAGFTAAFGQQSGVIAAGQDLFSLPRFPMGGEYTSLADFSSKLLMKKLSVRVVSPDSPLIKDENPPKLRFYLNQENVDDSSLRCYVSGKSDCLISRVSGEEGLYEAESQQPIVGRRGKYTLTATSASGKSWYWFSQPWFLPRVGEMTDQPVSR